MISFLHIYFLEIGLDIHFNLLESNDKNKTLHFNFDFNVNTGDEKAGLNFISNVLEAGKQYRLRLSIQPPSGSTGYSEHVFMTNLPPYNGTCSVSPLSGTFFYVIM